jgi:hypothetical protein
MPRHIFLDSKDLIALVRRSEPMSVDDARAWFHERNAKLVLSHTTVSEFVPVDDPDRLRIRGELQQLESFPVTYIRFAELLRVEARLARKAFAAGEEYPRFIPFRREFWQTFWPLVPEDGEEIVLTRELERRLNYRLDEQVFDLWTRSNNFRNLHAHTARLQRKMSAFRADVRPRRERFRSELQDALDEERGPDFEALAKWLSADATRAPAWRLLYEVLEQWRANKADDAKDGDLNDITHITFLPFVDAATLDGRFVTYVCQAAQQLRQRTAAIDYDRRVFRSFAEVIENFDSSMSNQ